MGEKLLSTHFREVCVHGVLLQHLAGQVTCPFSMTNPFELIESLGEAITHRAALLCPRAGSGLRTGVYPRKGRGEGGHPKPAELRDASKSSGFYGINATFPPPLFLHLPSFRGYRTL